MGQIFSAHFHLDLPQPCPFSIYAVLIPVIKGLVKRQQCLLAQAAVRSNPVVEAFKEPIHDRRNLGSGH